MRPDALSDKHPDRETAGNLITLVRQPKDQRLADAGAFLVDVAYKSPSTLEVGHLRVGQHTIEPTVIVSS